MGRGSSGIGAGGGTGSTANLAAGDFPEAFQSGVDFQSSGDVDHNSRTVTSSLQRQWDSFASQMSNGVTATDEQRMMKDWDYVTDSLYGYIRTTNSFAINKALYDPNNAGKTDAQIFTRTDRSGVKRDLQTVQTLDKSIQNNVTPADASYTRYSGKSAIQASYGLTNAQMNMIMQAPNMNAQQLTMLNRALSGTTSFSKAYTSVSANKSMNAFSNPRASQSRGYIFQRTLNVPKGTHAYAARRNAQESEVIFGRKMQTKLRGISVSNDGHIVFHEDFDGYR